MDVQAIRADFPALQRTVNGQQLVYLDSAATSQKPQQVIDAVSAFYESSNANVHRCIHTLAEEATEAYDGAHERVADFINAPSWRQVVFAKNTTEALNCVAHHYRGELDADDEILLTGMEHHSMIVPWQRVAEKTGATLRYVDVTEDGRLDMDDFHAKLSDDTAVVGAVHISNVLGTVNPIEAMVDAAHDHGAVFVLDAAQSVPHMPVDVQELGVDFAAFSGHKMCGPTGIGVLYGKPEHLEGMEPFLTGGDMISRVSRQEAEWADLPWKFEAGTPNVAGAVGLHAAIGYLESVGMDRIRKHGRELAQYAYAQLSQLDPVRVVGPEERIGLTAFTVENAHPHDLSTLLNEQGIAIRGGHHCAQPLGETLGVTSTARASYYVYNTREEIDALVEAVQDAAEVFS